MPKHGTLPAARARASPQRRGLRQTGASLRLSMNQPLLAATSLWAGLRADSAASLPVGDRRTLAMDVLALSGAVALALYALTWLFLPVTNWTTRWLSGGMALLPLVLHWWVGRHGDARMAMLALAGFYGLGAVWVAAAGSVYTAHASFFMVPLVFLSFVYGPRAALAALLLAAVVLGGLAWRADQQPLAPLPQRPYAQAWLQFQFCALTAACALVLRINFGRHHASALQAQRDVAAASEAAATHARLSLALQAARASAWTYDGTTGRIHTDGRLAGVIGLVPQQGPAPLGLLREQLLPHTRDSYDRALQRLAHSTPDDLAFELDMVAEHAGQPVMLRAVARVERDAQGRAQRAWGLLLDETDRALERQRTQQALEQARLAAESANQAKSDLLSRASHDLRTPMAAVIGLTDLAQREADPARAQDLVRRAHSSARSMLALLDDILDLSRLEAGRLNVQLQPVVLADLVEPLRHTLAQTAQDKGLALVFHVSPALPAHWMLDPLRLQQVLQNLLGNALKFTSQGQVTLTLEPAADGGLHVAVTDTGPGIAPAARERIFEPFEQLGPQTRPGGSAGLGLTIARQLVSLMGGELQLQSQLGQGSCCRIGR